MDNMDPEKNRGKPLMNYGKLDPEKKNVWVEALRSGKYQQGRCYLNASRGFCCLGVYADAVEHVEWHQHTTSSYFMFELKTHEVDIPEYWLHHQARKHLAIMNDTYKNDFNEIADWIEENL